MDGATMCVKLSSYVEVTLTTSLNPFLSTYNNNNNNNNNNN